jgi:hypothetical protein
MLCTMTETPPADPPRANRKLLGVLRGRLLAESLRVGHDLRIPALVVTRLGRHDVSSSTTPAPDAQEAPAAAGAVGSQPQVWTFVDFEAPADQAETVAEALARILEPDNGWWADFVVADVHYVVFADRVFRYRIGDADARDDVVADGLRAGTPRHQLDWGP